MLKKSICSQMIITLILSVSLYAQSDANSAAVVSGKLVQDTRQDTVDSVQPENKLEEFQARFNEILDNHQQKGFRGMFDLIRLAGPEEKSWLRNELIKHIRSNSDRKIRVECLINLTRVFPEDGFKVAEQIISSNDPAMRYIAVDCLGSIGSQEAFTVLTQIVKSGNEKKDIVEVAISSIGHIGGREAYDFLFEIWNSPETDWYIKERTLIALGATGIPDCLPIFDSVLQQQENLSVRLGAAAGLHSMVGRNKGDVQIANQARTIARKYFNDNSIMVRINMANILGITGESQDIKFLEILLSDPQSSTRSYSDGRKETVYLVREEAQKAIDRIKARISQ